MEQKRYLNKLWSFKGQSIQQPTNKSEKAPCFKPALFANNSMSPSSHSSSSFYSGKVQYGGAMSTLQNNLSSPYIIPKIKKVTGKTASANKDNKFTVAGFGGSLSSTARKILQTLEKMSAPLRDVKKIPSPSLNATRLFAGHSKKRPLGCQSFESNKKFCPPNSGRILLAQTDKKYSPKIPLDNSLSTHSMIKNVSSSEGSVTPFSTSHKGKPAILASLSSSSGLKLPITTNHGGGKMRLQRKNQSHYTAAFNDFDEGDDEHPNLPEVTFTINKLPSFNFNQPDSTSTPAPPKQSKKSENDDAMLESKYTFTVPTRSTRIKKKNSKSTHFINNTQNLPKNKPEKNSFPVQTFKISGSVMDILGDSSHSNKVVTNSESKPSLKETFQKPTEKLKSEVNWIDSDHDKSKSDAAEVPKQGSTKNLLSKTAQLPLNENSMNVACTTARLDTKRKITDSSTKPPLSELFKKPKDKWECDVCMILNENTKTACSACSAARPDSKRNLTDSTTKPPLSELFKKPKDKWECNVCMILNENTKTTCSACNAARPDSQMKTTNSKTMKPPLSELFKKPKDKWECNVCMILNENTKITCSACNAAKPDSKRNLTDSTTKPPLSELFKKPKDKWECNVCLILNENTKTTCSACETARPDSQMKTADSKTMKPPPSQLFKKPNDELVINESKKTSSTASNLVSQKVVSSNPTNPSTAITKHLFGFSTSQATTCTTENAVHSFQLPVSKTSNSTSFGDPNTIAPNVPKIQAGAFDGFKQVGEFGQNHPVTAAVSTTSSASVPSIPKSIFKFGTNSSSVETIVSSKTSDNLNTPKDKFECKTNESEKTSCAASNLVSQKLVSSNSTISSTAATKHLFGFGTSQATTSSTENAVHSFQLPVSKTSNLTSFGDPNTISQNVPKIQAGAFDGFKQVGEFGQNHPVTAAVSTTSTESVSSIPKPMFTFGTNSGKVETIVSSKTSDKANIFTNDKTIATPPAQPPGFGNFSAKQLDVKSNPPAFSGFGPLIHASQENKSEPIASKSHFTGFAMQADIISENKPDSLSAKAPLFGGFGQSGLSQQQASFSFNAPATSTNTSVQVTAPKSDFTFGKPAITSQSQFSSNVFSNPSVSKSNQSSAIFQFGTNVSSAPQTQNNALFGSSTLSTNQKPVFNFGASGSDSSKQSHEVFQFGSTQTGSNTTGGFNFTGAIQNPTPSAGFTFGSLSSNKPMFSGNPLPNNPSFQFGSSQNQTNMQSGPNSNNNFQFSGTQQVPFGQAPNQSSSLFNIGQTGRVTGTPNRAMKQAKRRLRK